MSPRDLIPTRWKSRILTAGAMVGAMVVVAGAVNPVLRPIAKMTIVSALDSTYVLQQSYDKTQLRDSLTHAQETDSIFRMLGEQRTQTARVDSSLRCITRRVKPGWCE